MIGTGMPAFPLYLLLLVVGIALVGYVLVRIVGGGLADRPSRGRSEGDAGSPSAARILQERYARGDIDTEEYHRRMRALREGR